MGHRSVADCQRWISSKEFTDWLAYFELEPFGDDLLDHQMAQMQALIANINRDPKKGRSYKPEEFALRNKKPDDLYQEEITPGEIFRRFKAHLGLVKK